MSVTLDTARTATRLDLYKGLLRTARPKQWAKNVLVLAAPVAGGRIFEAAVLGRTALVFVLFCCAASGIYLLNDALDAEADRAHPVKRNRPVASGIVPVPVAFAVGIGLSVSSIVGGALLLNAQTGLLLAVYAVVQILYCLHLKHVAVLDIAVVASGFLMRGLAGGTATEIAPSQWFLVTVGFGSLFVVGAKRASELAKLGDDAKETRKLLGEYSESYLRFVWQGAAALMMLSYCLWALEPDGSAVAQLRMLSIVPMTLAVLRYALIVDKGEGGAPEDVLLGDRVILILAAIWTTIYGASVFL
ncbi:decaprenyl-phosphate phosphoribosyltransferase [Actinocorallia sp. A-T 12471]|uniref:decaprenyl-phosphate phosphoribosyltransferase n=1 Tax=Actinocorallia sp. A-T 12471 TaxID=3089813 RepID=UPI0029CD96E9|nr:decaprenyl-phosphate phosphoribosyltransferase [Actinocorallia sp. A-T 12471]MDX6744660.1 decaprenyl-phosphate phosphoribosyltransferase [Actinocorallia sp. A-T 12471]